MTERNTRDVIDSVFKLYDELNKVMDENNEEIETLKDEVESVFSGFERDEVTEKHTVSENEDSYTVTFDFGEEVSKNEIDVIAISTTRAMVRNGDVGITINLPDDTDAENNTVIVNNGVVTVEFGRDD